MVLRRNNLGDHGKYADYWKERVAEGSEIAVALPVGPNELTSQVWFGQVAAIYQYKKKKFTIVKLTVLDKGDLFPGEILDPETGKRRTKADFDTTFDAPAVLLTSTARDPRALWDKGTHYASSIAVQRSTWRRKAQDDVLQTMKGGTAKAQTKTPVTGE